MPLLLLAPNIKFIGINLLKDIEDLLPPRKIKGDLTKWEDIPCSWFGQFSMGRMKILLHWGPKAIDLWLKSKSRQDFSVSFQYMAG